MRWDRLPRGFAPVPRGVPLHRALLLGTRSAPRLNGAVLTLSAPWPWTKEETPLASADAVGAMARARWGDAFAQSAGDWQLPSRVTRVYDSRAAMRALDWRPRWTFEAALARLARGDEATVRDGLF